MTTSLKNHNAKKINRSPLQVYPSPIGPMKPISTNHQYAHRPSKHNSPSSHKNKSSWSYNDKSMVWQGWNSHPKDALVKELYKQ